MKKLFAVLLPLLLSPAVFAQELPKFDAPLPAREKILRMHYSGWNEWALKHAPAANEMEQDGIAHYYADLREKSNAPRRAGKPALRDAMKAVGEWSHTYYDALYNFMEGGTLYTHSGNRSEATLADVEAEALDQWSASPKPTRLVTVSFAKYHKAVGAKGDTAKSLATEARALEKAQSAIAKLPPGPRAVLAKYVHALSVTNWGEAP